MTRLALVLTALLALAGCNMLGNTFDQMNDPYRGGVPSQPPEEAEETDQ